MAKDVEIELKLPLLNGDAAREALAKLAKKKYENFQHDVYFNSPGRDFLAEPDNICEWLRIRLDGDKAQINYKDWQPHEEKIKTHSIEYETNVDSYDQLEKIFTALGFKKLIEVKKTRQAWSYKDVEICLDSVEGLGEFIELEYKGDLDSVEAAREYLFAVLGELNAETGELDLKGYPYLLLGKKGLLG